MTKKNWISVKRGLSEDPKHRQAMGEAIWLFLHIIDAADWEKGMVYDWKDNSIAADMSLSTATIRAWRTRLSEAGYITCKQKQHGLEVVIHNWIDPRNYSGKRMNVRQGDMDVSPSDLDYEPDMAQGDIQGDTQGTSAPIVNPTSFIESTSTSTSTSTSKDIKHTHTKPDFVNLSVTQAASLPEIRLYRETTGSIPGQGQWETVWQTIRDMRTEGTPVTVDRLRPFFLAWAAKGFKSNNLDWLTEWAKSGKIPENGHSKQTGPKYPARGDNSDFFRALAIAAEEKPNGK